MAPRPLIAAFAVAAVMALVPRPAAAQTLAPQDRLCDPTFEDCRADILTYISQETVEIDMGFWAMTDARYSNALVAAWRRGVRIRLLVDPRCAGAHGACQPALDQLAAAGVPMRNRITSGILHWKCILFAGQQQLEFAGANYTPFEMTNEQPYVNFTDEVVAYSKDPAIVASFMTKFDDLWTSTTEFGDYANVTAPLQRSYPISPIDPQLNFPPDDSYRSRALAAYAAEQQAIDVLMFRITDERESDGIIAAINRGLPVRLISDTSEYRNPDRLWDSYNVDKMFHAGVQVRLSDHQGINHEKAVILRGSGMVIFGSSNWTSPSTDSQREHNMFTTAPWMFAWLDAQFTRKWTNGTGNIETKAFVPLPPGTPVSQTPANGATGVATSGTSLVWYAGPWAHLYDIYFGTTPNPPLLDANRPLGPSQYSTDYRRYALPALQPGTRYYWKIVSKTMAFVTATGPVWSFTTAGTSPGNLPPSVTLTAPAAGSTYTAPASIALTASAADSDGTISKVDFYAGTTLLGTDTAAPYTTTWTSVAAGTYSLTAVATDNASGATTSTAVSVTVTGGQGALPSGWSNADVGATGAAGSARAAGGTFTVTGAGADVWGTADAFQFAYRTLDGDGSIVARVASIQAVNAWTKAGVMIRNSLSPSAAHGFMLVASSAAKGTPFQRRTVDGGTSVSTPGALVTAPYWVKLVREGGAISAYESSDGAAWSLVGSDTLATGTTVLIGLAVSSHVAGTAATATFDNVTITAAAPGLPEGWSHGDVGAVGASGNAAFSAGTFTVSGAGADVWGTADAFHYAYTTLDGDGEIVARVASIESVNAWTKAGVMIRGSLSPSSAHGFMLVAPSATKGTPFQRRTVDDGASASTPGALVTAPYWVKLVRSGTTISGYESSDGAAWTLVASDTVAIGTSALVGLAVSSHVAGTPAAATFDNVTVTPASSPPAVVHPLP